MTCALVCPSLYKLLVAQCIILRLLRDSWFYYVRKWVRHSNSFLTYSWFFLISKNLNKSDMQHCVNLGVQRYFDTYVL